MKRVAVFLILAACPALSFAARISGGSIISGSSSSGSASSGGVTNSVQVNNGASGFTGDSGLTYSGNILTLTGAQSFQYFNQTTFQGINLYGIIWQNSGTDRAWNVYRWNDGWDVEVATFTNLATSGLFSRIRAKDNSDSVQFNGGTANTTLQGFELTKSSIAFVGPFGNTTLDWTLANTLRLNTSSFSALGLIAADISSGQCVQTTIGGRLTGTGTPCGSGSGSFATKLPFPDGATNYARNNSSLQSGSTVYPDFLNVGSSATINGPITLASSTTIRGQFVDASGSGGSLNQVWTSSSTPGGPPSWQNPTTVIISTLTNSLRVYGTVISSGVTDGSISSSTGTVGEIVSSTTVGDKGLAGTAVFTDVAAITLSSGTWDIEASITGKNGGATYTAGFFGGVSVTSGNTCTECNEVTCYYEGPQPTIGYNVTYRISPCLRVVAAPTTFYLKARAGYSLGLPLVKGTIQALRYR